MNGELGRDRRDGIDVADLMIEVPDGRRKRVLIDGLSFRCEPGTLTALTGPSGCGKTTLLTCVAGVAEFQAGRVCLDGVERGAGRLAKPAELRTLGIMFQDYRLVRCLDVRDNVALSLVLAGWGWRSARAPAEDLLEQFGLGGSLRSRPSALSGGEQQRVALARAVVGRPSVVLADEPSAHLDAESAKVLVSYLRGLANWGACIMVSSHDPRLLGACQQRIEL